MTTSKKAGRRLSQFPDDQLRLDRSSAAHCPIRGKDGEVIEPSPRRGPGLESWRLKNLERVRSGLAKALDRLRPGEPPKVIELLDAMAYALLGGGKQLRPLLALAAAEAVGGRAVAALPPALAVEMVHAYSLVHDDLPAMDDDDLRRGRPTCHKVYGEAAAILAGDALLTLAFQTLAESGLKTPEAARRANLAIVHLARAAGAAGMVGGQMLDLAFEKRPDPASGHDTRSEAVTGDMVKIMETRKTGELMAAALVGGAIFGGGGAGDLRLLRRLGLTLGLAFQIRDDLLNQEGDPALTGKAVGSDAARGKASFPNILGRAEAEREYAGLTGQALAWAASFKQPGRRLVQIIDSLVHRRA